MKAPRVLATGIPLVALVSTAPTVLAQADGPQPSSRLAVYLLSWLPLLVIIAFWFMFMRRFTGKQSRTAQHIARSERHMTEVEDQLKRIVTLLEKGSQSK